MTIQIIAVGRIRDKRHLALIDEYAKRLRSPWDLEFIEIKEGKSQNADEVKSKEGKDLIAKCDGRWVVALEEAGSQYDSVTFSKKVQAWMDDAKKVSFLIGGAHGLSEEVRERADSVLSLSEFTFPHEMARMILVEQIYRAMTIANGTPYHK